MAGPSVTYTFANSTTADATQVNQNFTDLINGATDGTKDYSINALTTASTATLNGNVVLGSGSTKTITVNGSLASTIPILTDATYDIGSSTFGLRSIYFGANSQRVNIKASASMSATYTLTLPTTAGTNTYKLISDGSGVLSWVAGAIQTQTFTSGGTFTPAAGVTSVLVCGCGGGGGGGGASGSGYGGTGGGGAGWSCQVVAVTPGTGYPVTIGTGGTGGTAVGSGSGGAGGAGADTTFGSLATFKGGIRGLGGQSSVGSLSAFLQFGIGAGTGGHGGMAGDGTNGSTPGFPSSTASGGSADGGVNSGGGGGAGLGAGGAGATSVSVAGSDAAANTGGGGGGGKGVGGAGSNGGAGGSGKLIVAWCV